jgi:hypothetical protein
MISMTGPRLGALRCPVAMPGGAGPKAASGDAGASWLERHRLSSFSAVRTVELIPPYIADNTTRVSVAPERSP